ncbi:hypothetical protein SCORR_v1c05910 [Spiroplasma corruscae]|uniref:Uncharacterized protein n=1 Tax=Spiroplasma corruscae TaxID=216934 RepID=A0A222EQ40_9MOLU|nr:hypothetical protein [Spiroplasma corruscae]ASP28363.1 hypothetical protein SCORR_v1c05910 [Spiroplasma corruscae]
MTKGIVSLKLSKYLRKIEVVTKIFKKSSFDLYLVASIIKNIKDPIQAIEFIKEITGNGSLYKLFSSLYLKKSKEFSGEDIENILNNSLVPTFQVSNWEYYYYPSLDITIIGNKVFAGDIYKDGNYIINNLNPDEDFVSSKVVQNILIDDDYDNYEYIYENNICKIKLVNNSNKYYELSLKDFTSSIEERNINLLDLKYDNQILEGRFDQLNNEYVMNLNEKELKFFKDSDLYIIEEVGVRQVKICKFFGTYWYSSSVIEYSKDQNISELALNFLIDSNKIYEVKNKLLLNIIENINSYLIKCNTVNSYLKIKNSNNFITLGLKLLINKEETFNWSDDVLKIFLSNYTNLKELLVIYSLNNKLDYTISNLIEIFNSDKRVMSEEDITKVTNHLNDVEKLHKEINILVGEMSQSGVRENMKKIKIDSNDLVALKKFYNKHMAHKNSINKETNLENLKEKLIYFQSVKKVHDKVLKLIK